MTRRNETTDLAAPAATAPPADPAHVAQVKAWILTGASEHEIKEAAAKQWPDAGDPTPTILAAMIDIEQAGSAQPELVRGWCIEATRHVYQQAMMVGDLATALRAIKQLHSLAA